MRALKSSALPSLEAYLTWLESLPEGSQEWGRLAGHLTVGETYFFRDQASVEALEREVLPSLIAARRSEGNPRLRVWSAGCATGEEAYTLAILLDRLLPDRAAWTLTVLATDINLEAIEAARRGIYREWALRDTPRWIRERYFRPRGSGAFELDPEIRRMVSFAPLNLATETYPALLTDTVSMDLILCRNVLMYFTRGVQRAAAARLRDALAPGGWLVVSPAETSAVLFQPLAAVNFPGAIFYRKGRAAGPSFWDLVSRKEEAGTAAALPEFLEPTEETLPEIPAEWVPPQSAPPPAPSEKAPESLPLAEDLLGRARALAGEGKLEEARRLCEASLAREPLDPDAHLLLAEVCQEQGEVLSALAALGRALYLESDLVPAHFLLGSLLFRQGDRRRGCRSMETVTRLLASSPREAVVPGSGGLTAGRLHETARAYLELESLGGREGGRQGRRFPGGR